MDDKERRPEELLLDWHLDRLDDDDRVWLERELLRDAKLRRQGDRLRAILEPLDQWVVTPTPPNLHNRVLDFVGRRSETSKPSGVLPIDPHVAVGGGRRFSMRDIVAVAACIGLLFGVAFPGLSGLRSRSQRQLCASNLSSIYRGVGMYQQAFAGALPFAGSTPGTSWLPNGSADAPFASNSRHVYLLVRLNFGPKPQEFICPSDKRAEPMMVANYADHDDFGGARQISYDSLNLACATPLNGGTMHLRPSPSVPYLSDANPLFVDGRFDDTVDPYATNSATHGKGTGQTVLALDGSASWTTTPNYGRQHDNLWIAGNVRRYTGTEARQNRDDAFLVPGFPGGEADDVGPRDE